MFSNGQKINIELESFDANSVKYILLKDRKAFLVYEADNKGHSIRSGKMEELVVIVVAVIC